MSQAAFRSAQYAERQKVDDLTLAISSAWTNITEAAIQIEIAQANLDVAGETCRSIRSATTKDNWPFSM